ncbi:MAG: AarF/UbiB family protein [Acidobacteriota bacterium]
MSPIAAFRRLSRVLRVLLTHGPGLVWHALWRTGRAPDRLRRLVQAFGGTYVKFGQVLALQPDLLPRAYCDALLELLDRIEPFPFAEAARVLEAELGKPVDALFDAIDRTPLATASIGQIHVAQLDGQKLAVKVRRPAVEGDFEFDIRVMTTFVWLVERLRWRRLAWLVEPTREFVQWTREELDFRHEARYAAALGRQARDVPAQVVAEVVEGFTSRRTLVTRFLEGIPLLAYLRARNENDEVTLERVRQLGFDEATFAANLIDNFLSDVFRHGVYHADLHPANLFILPDNRVGYVDFGIIGVMSPHSRRHLVSMTLAVALGDIGAMAREYLEVTEHGPGSDYPGLRHGLETLARGWYEDGPQGRRLTENFTIVMLEMLQLSRRTRIMPERDIVKYIRSAIAIDGLIHRFSADFDLGEHLASSCAQLILGQVVATRLTGHRLLDWINAVQRLTDGGSDRLVEALGRI